MTKKQQFYKSIKNRFFIISASIVLLSVMTILFLFYAYQNEEGLHNNEFAIRALCYQTKTELIVAHRAMKDVVLASDKREVDIALERYTESEGKLLDFLATVKKIDSEKIDTVDDIIQEIHNWDAIRQNTIDYKLSGMTEEASENTKQAGERQVDLISSKVNGLINQVLAETETAQEKNQRANLLFIGILLILGVSIVLLSSVMQKRIIRKFSERDEEIEFAREELYRIIKSVADGIIVVDSERKISMMNKVAEELSGWMLEEAKGMDYFEVFRLERDNGDAKFANSIEEVFITDEICLPEGQTVLLGKNGMKIDIEDNAAPLRDKHGKTTGVVFVFRDVTEEKARRERIRFLSYHDQLTKLYNRNFLEEELQRIDTDRYYPISVIIGDLNNLKITNDTYGHHAGDELLKAAANAISEGCRKGDIIARWGGDEFVVLLPDTDAATALEVIDRINLAVADASVKQGILSISFGFATKRTEDEEMEAIFKIAEDTMYQNKLKSKSDMQEKSFEAMLETLFEKSDKERKHSENVERYAGKLAMALNFSKREVTATKTAAKFHDIGKLVIKDSILEKEGKLEKAEWLALKRHSEAGYRIVSTAPYMAETAAIILGHHEKWDGTGYPKGLKSDEIQKISRIIAIADAYDAMISERTYKEQLSEEEAEKELLKYAGSQFDPDIVKVFVEEVLRGENRA